VHRRCTLARLVTGEATVTLTVPDEQRLAGSPWRLAARALRPLWIAAGLLAYALVLGGSGGRLVLFAVLLVALFGWLVVAAVVTLVAQLTGPPPALTREGVRLRLRPWRRRVVTIPWPEITLVWIGYRGRRRYLCLQAERRGPHAGEWDPRGRRLRRGPAPLAVLLPGTAAQDRLAVAVAALSGGTVTMADRGPEAGPDTDAWAARRGYSDERRAVPPALSVPVLLVAGLVGVPVLLDVAPPWNQPWWPGVTAAASIPDACGVFTDDQARTLRITGRDRTADRPGHQQCEFTVPQGHLTVSLERAGGLFGGGTAKADARAVELAGALDNSARRVPGVGDVAWLVANPPGTTTYLDRGVADLVARRANVVLVIAYGGEQEPGPAQEAVLGAARATLAALDVR
jgi:hypothetical protein